MTGPKPPDRLRVVEVEGGSYEWDLDGDGIFEASSQTVDVSLRDQGPVTVKLRVTDDDGASSATTRTITFTDVPPLIALDDNLVIGADGSCREPVGSSDPGVNDEPRDARSARSVAFETCQSAS